jgi:hypothetical protein
MALRLQGLGFGLGLGSGPKKACFDIYIGDWRYFLLNLM